MTEQTDLIEVVAKHDAFICGCDRPKEHMIGARALVQELAVLGVVILAPENSNDPRTTLVAVDPLLPEVKR